MDSKSAKTRTRILDAAAEVLSRKGYAGTRLTDVAEVAQLQAPAIYYYFKSREVLIEEVMWMGTAEMRKKVVKALSELPENVGPLGRIEAAVETHIRYVLEVSDHATAAIRNANQVPEGIRARQRVEELEYGTVWRQLFEDAVAAEAVREELDVTACRLLVIGALNWAPEWYNPRRMHIDAVVRTAVAVVRNGIATPEALEAEFGRAKPKARGRRSRSRAL